MAERTVQIVSRWDSSRVLFTYEVPEGVESGMEMRHALEAATASGAYLRGANLRGANLSDANLRGANLGGADLSGANLGGADLSGANLRGADLSGANLGDANLGGANLGDANLGGANLSGANLRGANLRGANLSDANLSGANLSGANLSDANLSGAYLSDANLSAVKADVFDILLRAPKEVAALRAALIAGKVDGSVYEGECACLVGTIANARGANYQELGAGITPDSGRPAESFFFAIKRGDTPETNSASKLAVEWIDEFTALLQAAVEA
jgi:uncharacterized protein YjbI with pentapeptide repeats